MKFNDCYGKLNHEDDPPRIRRSHCGSGNGEKALLGSIFIILGVQGTQAPCFRSCVNPKIQFFLSSYSHHKLYPKERGDSSVTFNSSVVAYFKAFKSWRSLISSMLKVYFMWNDM